MRSLINAWLDQVRPIVTSAVMDHPTVLGLRAGSTAMRIVADAFRKAAPSAPPAASSSSSGGSSILSRIAAAVLPPVPTWRPPNTAAIRSAAGSPLLPLDRSTVSDVSDLIEQALRQPIPFQGRIITPFMYTEETLRSIRRTRSLSSVFGAERLALVDEHGRKPAAQLADLGAQYTQLRDALRAVLGRILPPAIAAYLPRLDELFRQLEKEHDFFGRRVRLYPGVTAQGPVPDLPVQQIPENDRLLPVVHRLRVVSTDPDRTETSGWTDRLRELLMRQSYRINPNAGAATAPA